ncbi:hypothetical protein LPJ59_006769, partial [Coemansia sp. RSA 2399]
RARFHRQNNTGEFEIKVRDGLEENNHSDRLPASLVRGLRRVSINEFVDTGCRQSAACSNELPNARIDKVNNRPAVGINALMVGVPLKEQACNSANKATLIQSDAAAAAADEADNATTQPDDDDSSGVVLEQPSDSGSDFENNEELRQEEPGSGDTAQNATTLASSEVDSADGAASEPPEDLGQAEVPEKPQGRQHRKQRHQREKVDSKDIEAVLQEVPKRMTRSMAKQIGVQAPRRYFGEGVSASQILRPAKPAPATRKSQCEAEASSGSSSAADEQGLAA